MAILIGNNQPNKLIGTEEDDVIVGVNADDTLNGTKGDDYVAGGNGADMMRGGAGNDTVDAGNGDDFVNGQTGDDSVQAGRGNDTVDGGRGDDIVVTGRGDDLVFGGEGSDTVVIGANLDRTTISYGTDENGGYVLVESPDGTDKIYGAEFIQLNDAVIPVCFFPGTMIATPEGEVAVETLKAGDLVLTADGRTAPIRWMGRQTVSTRFADPMRALPIRIRAGALADNLPARDLLVSPAHAVLVEGMLIQAGALVNGTTIVRDHAVPEIFTYWHIELGDHALVLAEGTPAETFIDSTDREAFDNWAEYAELVADEAPAAELALPRAKSHRQVPAAIRAAIEARATMLVPVAA